MFSAYLASRRGSRDSQASNLSNVSNEDVGPLNFSAHPRVRQRRTSNFLELPGILFDPLLQMNLNYQRALILHEMVISLLKLILKHM